LVLKERTVGASDYNLDPAIYPCLVLKTIVQHGNVTNASGNTDVDADFEEISCLERDLELILQPN
jgi:hypothetical protein